MRTNPLVEISRLRYVTERYPHMQGLRVVLLSLPLFGSGTWRAGWLSGVPGLTDRPRAWWWATLAVAVAVSYPIRAWYRRRWGLPALKLMRTGAVTLVASFAGILILVAFQPDHWVMSMPALFLGLTLIGLGAAERGFRWHYLIIGALWVGYSQLSRFGVSEHIQDVSLDYLIGLGFLVGGLGDHWALTRTLERQGEKPTMSPLNDAHDADEEVPLDRAVHAPARLKILAVLDACRSADFLFLQSTTGLTQGNLSSHLLRLESEGLVVIEKSFKGKRTYTTASLTEEGRKRFREHWRQLDAIRKPASAWRSLFRRRAPAAS